MRTIKLTPGNCPIDFSAAHAMADKNALELLGDVVNVIWFDRKRKIESPNISCDTNSKLRFRDYAKSFDSDLEIDVCDGSYNFFYKKVEDYIS